MYSPEPGKFVPLSLELIHDDFFYHPCTFAARPMSKSLSVLQCVAVCCSVLQCVAVCCSVVQCGGVCCIVLV